MCARNSSSKVAIPLSTFYELERAQAAGAGGKVRLFVHTHVREDQLALYGFATEQEKAIFERLIQVSGIGSPSRIIAA